ncbi:chromosomal replication initiator protein DnaA [Ligilactobacillus salitolerans]|uniref:Chromosomal replication initiator protein DnaA n=1 Tax=Ligilactobacillus salitolerans TaxID=1808352 RepID=A0A401IQ50_9LACO|nr:chromosomal replication initiator protein DnaA [Ligilactobacillus salitolerans]GBG93656.1 chromosomal replication initiator protein DnaA [Ligilactobacillus salitolerans]
MPDLETLWQFICEKFNESFSAITYKTWIETAKPVQFADKTLVVEVPSKLHRDYWTQSVTPQIVDMLEESLGYKITILPKTPEEPNPLEEFDPAGATSNTETEATVLTTQNDNKKVFVKDAQLNERYTFETFVVGKGNQLAHAAALAVAEEPGIFYNPLFFYGGVGLGKTHLMHAIGHQMLENRPTAKVKYVTSESFANDFINSIQTKRQEEFRQEYRNVDLLLVDDIQFFADKVGTQEEFFHTFNALYDDKKQIVLSSDRLPNEIPKLQQRLVSRFKWGLSVDITPPDFETRIAILRNKAEAEHLDIPSETLSYIAGQFDSNIRELEGALMRVQAYASMSHTKITTGLAAEALKSLNGKDHNNKVTISMIQNKVAKYYHVTVAELKGRKRVKAIVIPRQVAMYLSRKLTDSSLPRIGQEFGDKDHTTVLHAYEKIAKMLANDPDLEREVAELKAELKA